MMDFAMEQGQRFCEENLQITCLWPQEGEKENWEPGNETSMVLSVTFGEFDILFTGDLEKEGEETLAAWIAKMQGKGRLPENYEILKAGHYGSKNASQEDFLRTVAPSAAWISAGKGTVTDIPTRIHWKGLQMSAQNYIIRKTGVL